MTGFAGLDATPLGVESTSRSIADLPTELLALCLEKIYLQERNRPFLLAASRTNRAFRAAVKQVRTYVGDGITAFAESGVVTRNLISQPTSSADPACRSFRPGVWHMLLVSRWCHTGTGSQGRGPAHGAAGTLPGEGLRTGWGQPLPQDRQSHWQGLPSCCSAGKDTVPAEHPALPSPLRSNSPKHGSMCTAASAGKLILQPC